MDSDKTHSQNQEVEWQLASVQHTIPNKFPDLRWHISKIIVLDGKMPIGHNVKFHFFAPPPRNEEGHPKVN